MRPTDVYFEACREFGREFDRAFGVEAIGAAVEAAVGAGGVVVQLGT